MDLQGCRVLITGGSRGIGRAIALALAKEQCKIGINYVSHPDAAGLTVKEVEQLGGQAVALAGDVGHKDQAYQMVRQFQKTFGSIDVLINNAGMSIPGTILTLSEEDWQRGLDVHMSGTFYCTRAVVPSMIERCSGKIILMSSVSALRGGPSFMAYAAVKAGVLGFTRCLAYDLAEYGITVNALCPGLIDTDFHAATTPERRANNINNRVPLHRYGTAEEVADAALLLLRNDYITGEAITIDGGLAMRIV